jgi:type I restriction enzyme, R subunit
VPDVSATNFAFLTGEWSAVFEAAAKAESFVHADPRAACFYARRARELAVAWAYKSDASLHLPCCRFHLRDAPKFLELILT